MPNSNIPFFTIAIPTYNRLNYLKEAVSSILEQTFQDFEICISQDPTVSGPNMDVLSWSKDLANQDTRVRLRVNDTNRGLAGNWNELVKMASGQYMIIIGDDDRFLPTYLEEMAYLLRTYSASVAFCNQFFIDSKGEELVQLTSELNQNYGRTNLNTGLIEDPIKVVLSNSVPMSATVCERNLFLQFPFKEDLNTPEIEVFLRIALNGNEFAYLNKQLAEYRIHSLSATSSGLTIDRLLSYMLDIKVADKHEPVKKVFFADKIIPAINMSLRRGDGKLARKLLYSTYYPAKPIHKLVQFSCLFLPTFLTKKILA